MRITLSAIIKLVSRLWASAPRLRGNWWKASYSDAIEGGNKERGGKPEMGENSEVYSSGPGGDGQIKQKKLEIYWPKGLRAKEKTQTSESRTRAWLVHQLYLEESSIYKVFMPPPVTRVFINFRELAKVGTWGLNRWQMEVLAQLLHVGLDKYVVTSGLTGRATVIYFGLVPLYFFARRSSISMGPVYPTAGLLCTSE